MPEQKRITIEVEAIDEHVLGVLRNELPKLCGDRATVRVIDESPAASGETITLDADTYDEFTNALDELLDSCAAHGGWDQLIHTLDTLREEMEQTD